MNCFPNRQLRSFLRSRQFLILLISITLLTTLLYLINAHNGGTEEDFIAYSDFTPGLQPWGKDTDSILEHIRNNHLFAYDPDLPTNYSGGHEGWKQEMSRTVAKRLNFKRDGFFVECGAVDGVYLSNSLLLEQQYEWTGLLIEADQKSVPILKGRNRQAWVADVCLSPKSYPIEIEMQGHKDVMALSYFQNKVIWPGRRTNRDFIRKFKVQCFPLPMLMDALNRTEIDYFSLDVEGMELDILKTIPFDRIHIQLIGVEVRPGQKEEIQRFLEPIGYKRIKEIKDDDDSIHDDLYEFDLDP